MAPGAPAVAAAAGDSGRASTHLGGSMELMISSTCDAAPELSGTGLVESLLFPPTNSGGSKFRSDSGGDGSCMAGEVLRFGSVTGTNSPLL